MKRVIVSFLSLAALAAGTVAWAGSQTAAPSVNITLTRNAGLCVSEALSAGSGATVHVACQSGQFVDISPVPGRPFPGVHGGAYRFHLGGGAAFGSGSFDAGPFVGVGTVTALRVYYADGGDGPLEMLVSF